MLCHISAFVFAFVAVSEYHKLIYKEESFIWLMILKAGKVKIAGGGGGDH
jgi:hypothetical protein